MQSLRCLTEPLRDKLYGLAIFSGKTTADSPVVDDESGTIQGEPVYFADETVAIWGWHEEMSTTSTNGSFGRPD